MFGRGLDRGAIVMLAMLFVAIGFWGCGGKDQPKPTAEGAGAAEPASGPLGGGPGASGGALGRFDANGDGVIVADEVPEVSRARVMSADSNGDGKVTADEMANGHDRMRQETAGGRTDMTELIRRFDKDGDGQLTTEELPEAMRGRMIRADANGDGKLTKEELSQGQDELRGMPEGSGERRAGGRSFDRFDKNGDGVLSPDEIPPSMREELMRTDVNADGVVSREEANSAQTPPAPPK